MTDGLRVACAAYEKNTFVGMCLHQQAQLFPGEPQGQRVAGADIRDHPRQLLRRQVKERPVDHHHAFLHKVKEEKAKADGVRFINAEDFLRDIFKPEKFNG